MPIDPNIIGQLRQPEPVNPLSNIMQIMQLRQAQQLLPLKIQEAQQSMEEGQIKLRQAKQAEADRMTTDAAFKGALTVGPDGVPTWDRMKLLQAVPGHLAPVLGKTLDEADKTRTELLKAQQEVAAKQAEHGAGVAAAIQSAGNDPTFARQQFAMEAAANPSSAASIKQIIAKMDQLDQADPTGAQTKAFLEQATNALKAKGGPAFTTAGARAQASATGAAKLPGELSQQAATLAKTQADTVIAKQTAAGEKPIQPVDRERQAFEQKKFDQTLADFADKVRHEKVTEAETAKYHNMSIEAVDLTPEAKMKMAEMFASTGALPALGNGKAAAKARTDIINEAAAKFPQVDFASNKAAYQANVTSLKNMQKQSDFVNAFEATAGKNIAVFLEKAGKIVDTGSPLLNSPVRMLSDRVFGSENMAAFKAARETALTESAKVLESPQGNASLTVAGREAVKTLSDPDATLGQQVAAMKVLRQDMANRKQSNAETIKAIQDRIGQANPNAQPVMNPPARLDATPKEVTKAEYDALPVGSDYLKDGKHYTKK